MATTAESRLSWTDHVDREALAAPGTLTVDFPTLVEDVRRWTREAPAARTSLARPAESWLTAIADADTLAVTNVTLDTLEHLKTLHGYVLEPAWRRGTAVVVESEHKLRTLDPERFIDPDVGYAFTLQRALHAAHELFRPSDPPPTQPLTGTPTRLDDEQRKAVDAHDGVVQVIAPAGSGKTTVLVERVRELLRRGVPAQRILCTTFNRDAQRELQQRLNAAGLNGVEARTFHSLGRLIAQDHGTLRGEVRGPTLGQWKRICAIGAQDGRWIEPQIAREAIAQAKLGHLLKPHELAEAPTLIPDGKAIARIYAAYEHHQRELAANDFDDLIFLAVRGLQHDAALRARWQARFDHVLVDETQDVEPAQELLVRILAAPQDGLFCVGDEDQTLYGWRRASVHRMIALDRAYPGLQRISLAHNYRCPPEVVEASRALIEHNAIRFPKRILFAPGRAPGGARTITVREEERQASGAERVASALASRGRGQIVVLARTTNLLRTVALACADLGVRISAPPPVFEPQGARLAIEAYLRLCTDPLHARTEDLVIACRMPSRGLPFESEAQAVALLHAGATFTQALEALPAADRQRRKLDEAGRVLDALTRISDAQRFITYLRGTGGLDEHFAEQEATFGDAEQVELEVLEQASVESAGKGVAEYLALLAQRTDALQAIRDDAGGVELTTIHRAKGRQWPHVELFAAEERQLPHHHALDATPAEEAAGEGVEAERRLAYVAFTRAQERLVVTATRTVPSRFLTEAGLQVAQPYRPP
ncbi:MAG TPA: ATP-dependent helicase, partial [Solirubrobacteraceae bacterium]|nr:ATP-dependent helicase [Solirubrobacteraceae bacterium]